MRNMFKKSNLALTALMLGMASMANQALAQIDVEGVDTALGLAEADAHTIGTTVIAIVAGLVVVGIVIGLVRKL